MILLKNGTYIDWKSLEFSTGDFLVTEGAGGGISRLTEPPNGIIDKVLDCSGMYITKSFANGHHHAYSALARGMPAPKKNPENFTEILQYIWWNLDKALDRDMIRASALVTAMECALNGVTFVIDHHASPNAVPGSLMVIAEAFESAGLAHLLCYEISDRDGEAIARQGLAETESYLAEKGGLVGLHASFTVGNETMQRAVALAGNTDSGIHIHCAEDLADQQHCLKQYGCRVVERLHDAGVLQFPKTILAHCLHLNDHERRLVADSPVWIAENMESNLNNKVGQFKGLGLGANIFFGTDGMHSDMLRSAKATFFAGNGLDNLDYQKTYQRLRNVHRYLSDNRIAGDGDNCLVIMDYPAPTSFNTSNFYGHFLFGLESRYIRHVISGGKLIVHNRELVLVNQQEILAEAHHQAERLWARL
jgi:cytosine/adenosine deaminase-related metal-dependent hydrolase